MHPSIIYGNNIIVIHSLFYSTCFGKLQLVYCNGALTIPCQEAPTSKNTSTKLIPCLPLCSAQGFATFSHFNFSIVHHIINIYYTSHACCTSLFSARSSWTYGLSSSVNKSWPKFDNLG